MIYKAGQYMWTASGAGWAVRAYITGEVEAAVVSVLCLGMAVIWSTFK